MSASVPYTAGMNREQQILQAAEDLFFEHGFDGIGMDAIGKRVGITGGAIYRHFSGKDELLAVLFDRAIDTVLERLPPVSDDPDEDLRNLVEAHMHFATTHVKLAGIWNREQRSLADPYRRGYLRRVQRYVDRWRTCLEKRYPDASPEQIATAMRAAQALMLSEATRPPKARTVDNVDELLVDMVLRSLGALEG
jgi:AcrR family transcriptional regulator